MINRILIITKQLWVPIVWTALLFILLFLPGSNLESTPKWWKFPGYDKIIHWGLFAMFTALWVLYYLHKKAHLYKRIIGIITFIAIIIGIVTEYIQLYYIPNRSFDVYDIVADIVGSLTAACFFMLYPKEKLI